MFSTVVDGLSLQGTHSSTIRTLGFEQTLLDTRLALRFGLDETSPTAGLSLKFARRYKLDAAYVGNMPRAESAICLEIRAAAFL